MPLIKKMRRFIFGGGTFPKSRRIYRLKRLRGNSNKIDGFDIDDICIRKAKVSYYDNSELRDTSKNYLDLIERGEGQFTLNENNKKIC
jgi:chemotaxis methyl-accepting protein methylase